MKILSLGRLDVTIRRELQRACCHCGTVGPLSGQLLRNFPSHLQRCFVFARHTPPITSVPHDSASGGDVHRLVAVHFFVVPLPHPNRRNCPEKGHDAVQSPRLQSPRPFVDWVDWCGCGGCCLGCHRTDLVTLYVLRELGNYLLELLDTCLQHNTHTCQPTSALQCTTCTTYVAPLAQAALPCKCARLAQTKSTCQLSV